MYFMILGQTFADHDDILSAMTLTGKEIKWSGNALNDAET